MEITPNFIYHQNDEVIWKTECDAYMNSDVTVHKEYEGRVTQVKNDLVVVAIKNDRGIDVLVSAWFGTSRTQETIRFKDKNIGYLRESMHIHNLLDQEQERHEKEVERLLKELREVAKCKSA
uniref:Uncharacterized protein n=1 Tax=Pseudomonas phage RVTF4 TaxID=3236931 RepID=A0AB39CCY3_9VIRU